MTLARQLRQSVPRTEHPKAPLDERPPSDQSLACDWITLPSNATVRTNRNLNAKRASAFLVAFALLLGLPQFLVLCTPTDGAPQVEFSCARSCCEHDRPAPGIADERGDPEEKPAARDLVPHHVHVTLGCELAPTPAFSSEVPPLAPAAEPFRPLVMPQPRRLPPDQHRETTGPPRPKPVLGEIASTVLLR